MFKLQKISSTIKRSLNDIVGGQLVQVSAQAKKDNIAANILKWCDCDYYSQVFWIQSKVPYPMLLTSQNFAFVLFFFRKNINYKL